jgi:1-acyl-sn-glycerol-3-phosphate acyltransferase
MNPEQLWQLLRENTRYQTPPDLDRGPLDRAFGWSSLWYYQKILRIIGSMSMQAGRGSITRDIWAHYQLCIFNAVEACGGRFDIDGFEHLAATEPPYVVVSNHMAMVETLFMPVLVQPFSDPTFVVKESLMNYPLLGRILHAVGAIPVTRSNPREDLRQVLTMGRKHLEAGGVVIVFPQATRSVEFEPENFNSIGVKLAQRAGVPVIPAALKTDFQSNGRIFKDFGRIHSDRPLHFRFGEPIPVGVPPKDAHARTVELIETSLAEWKALG